ncbi:hypothetical protein FRC11_001206, partial [Ceratobasidium sp. 423]
MAPDLDAPSTLPSSKTYEAWAASCPAILHDFEGNIGVVLAKVCPFCGKPKRLGSRSDQSLIEHMKSRACALVQQRLEEEIIGTSATEGGGVEPGPSTSGSSTQLSNLPPSSTLTPELSTLLACPGAEVQLSQSAWANYPWHLHDPSLNQIKSLSFYVCTTNSAGYTIHIRSYSCVHVRPTVHHKSCIPCAHAADSHEVRSIIQRTETEVPINGLNLVYYSHKQLADALDSKEELLKKYRLHGIEINRKASRLLGKLNDHKQLTMALAEVDDVAVSRIVRVALSQGCGPVAIVDRLKKAQEGLYQCQSYSKKNIDIALLSLHLGGPRLLNILSGALNMPSLSTVYRHAERTYMRPSIAFPTEDEVLANIESMCGRAKVATPATGIRGCSILIDEIALEERVRYSTAEDALVGLSRECTIPSEVRNIT